MQIQILEERTGLDRATIRYYEKEGLIRPNRLQNGYRDYSENDLNELLKIKLLRLLKVPLEQIIDIKEGRDTIDNVLNQQADLLQNKQEMLMRASEICKVIISSGYMYETLDPRPYLAMFEESVSSPNHNVEKTSDERFSVESHPFRRFLARLIDIILYGLIIALLIVVIFRIRPLPQWYHLVLKVSTVLFSVPFNALFLHLWGKTPGKWITGISLEKSDGSKLSFLDAMRREWNVIKYGFGLFIPIWSIIRLINSWRACKAGEWLDWEEYNQEIIYKPFRSVSYFKGGIATILIITIAVWVGYDAGLPKHRGSELTIEHLAENYNDYAVSTGYLSRMDDNGGFYQYSDPNTIYIDVDTDEEFEYEINYDMKDGIIHSINYTCRKSRFLATDVIPIECHILTLAVTAGEKSFRDIAAEIGGSIMDGIRSGTLEGDSIIIQWTAKLEKCIPISPYRIFRDTKFGPESAKYILHFQIIYK